MAVGEFSAQMLPSLFDPFFLPGTVAGVNQHVREATVHRGDIRVINT
jgi:hypothetical protein